MADEDGGGAVKEEGKPAGVVVSTISPPTLPPSVPFQPTFTILDTSVPRTVGIHPSLQQLGFRSSSSSSSNAAGSPPAPIATRPAVSYAGASRYATGLPQMVPLPSPSAVVAVVPPQPAPVFSQQPHMSFSSLLSSEMAASPVNAPSSSSSGSPSLQPFAVPTMKILPAPSSSSVPDSSRSYIPPSLAGILPPGKDGNVLIPTSTSVLPPFVATTSTSTSQLHHPGTSSTSLSLTAPSTRIDLNIDPPRPDTLAGPHTAGDLPAASGPPAAVGTLPPLQMLPPSYSNLGCAEPPPLPSADIVPREPVMMAQKGEGWPYSPQGWPHAADKWGWRVGKRTTVHSNWMDRYVSLPKSLAKGRKVTEFASRKSIAEYIKQTFPQTNVDNFFKSFEWKIPAPKVLEAPKVASVKRERPPNSGENSWQRPRKLCQAQNPHCNLETGKSALSGATETLACTICCSEPGFCRECKCVLCCKVFWPDTDETNLIRCMNRPIPGGAGICGHAAHLECAVKSQLARVVKKNGIDVEYICRRCDRKTNLRDAVARLIESVGRTIARPKVEKNLQLAMQIMQDSQQGVVAGRSLTSLIDVALKKVQNGADIQQVYKELTDQALVMEAGMQVLGRTANQSGEGPVHHQSEASLDQWLLSSSSPASRPSPATPSSLTSREESPNQSAVNNWAINARDIPDIINDRKVICTEADGRSPANYSKELCLPPVEGLTAPLVQPPAELKATGSLPSPGPTPSKSLAVSIEEHMKHCEDIANRVKGAGQFTGPAFQPAPVPQGSNLNLAGWTLGFGTGNNITQGTTESDACPAEVSQNMELTDWAGGIQSSQGTVSASLPSPPAAVMGTDTTAATLNRSYASRGLPSRLAAAQLTAEAPVEIEGLEMQYEDEISQALQKLKESQAAEYARAKELLLSQKNMVLQHCQLLKTVQQEFSKQTPRSKPPDSTTEPVRPAVQQTFDLSMDNLMNQFGQVQEEREVFQSMLAISNGFGQASKDYLRKHFDWPSQDSSVGH